MKTDNLVYYIFGILILMCVAMYHGFVFCTYVRQKWQNRHAGFSVRVYFDVYLSLLILILCLDMIRSIFLMNV
jgi:hypothetical protein